MRRAGTRQRSTSQRSTLGAILLLLLINSATACNVPVFRYALERWHPDAYRVALFHRGALSTDEKAIAAQLTEREEQGLTNIALRTIDVDSIADDEDRELFDSLDGPELPCLVVQYPLHLRIAEAVHQAPLNARSVKQLLESPARTELARRLAAGETAVWLFLETGDPEKDGPAAARVAEELKKLERSLKLPELTDSPEDALLAGPPLKVAFSVLRVSASAEPMLAAILVHSESDLAGRSDSMVFPVFGRGRTMLGLIGAGITPDNIGGSAAFLAGACSCQVKEQNPGFDLLLSADWQALFSQEGTSPIVVSRHDEPRPSEPELVPIPKGSPPPSAAEKAEPDERPAPIVPSGRTAILAAGAMLIALVALIRHLAK